MSSESGFKKHFADNNALTLKSAHTHHRVCVGGGGSQENETLWEEREGLEKKHCSMRSEEGKRGLILYAL